jgi:hypothetical protein
MGFSINLMENINSSEKFKIVVLLNHKHDKKGFKTYFAIKQFIIT